MWFWFGLEILKLVYKKAIFKTCKKFLQNSPQRVSKEVEFCADFKNVQKSWV